MSDKQNIQSLTEYLSQIPSISEKMGSGVIDGLWWVKFKIDISHPLAWRVVQELGHVLNYLSIDEKLPTIFMPVSPPPYMNGGPEDYLAWVIESTADDFTPESCREWLESRLPRPVNDTKQWDDDDDA